MGVDKLGGRPGCRRSALGPIATASSPNILETRGKRGNARAHLSGCWHPACRACEGAAGQPAGINKVVVCAMLAAEFPGSFAVANRGCEVPGGLTLPPA